MAERPTRIELPAPTAWPMVAALGITLSLAGLVMHVLVTIVGIILVFAGAIGWFRAVLPAEQIETVPLRAPALRPAPVQPARAAATLLPGEEGHRLALPVEIHPYSSGITGGLAGGVAMAIVACAYGLIGYGSLWYPINLLAAVAIPSLAKADTAQLASFNAVAFAVALIAHGFISIFVGLVYAVILPLFPNRPGLWGGLIAPLLWSGLLWATLGVINPTLNARIDWRWFVASQFAFGCAAGFVISSTQRIKTMQALPLAARAGIEAPGMGRKRDEP